MRTDAPIALRDAVAPFAMAIDIGSSSTRVIAFDARARPVSGTLARIRHEIASDRNGAATLDADALVAAVETSLDRVVRRLGGRATETGAIAISVFWHSIVGVDARGRAITPVYTWADMRARTAARALRRELDPDAFHARTGCYLHATYPIAKLRWLHDADPKRFARAARWMSLGEYVALRLTGEAACSHSIASATGLYDHGARAWDANAVAAAGVAMTALSPISDAWLAPLRRAYASRWPALARAVWLPALGDGALANVGSGCTTAERAAVSLGTSGAVRACYPAARAQAPAGLWEYRLDERYVVVGGAVNNGWNVIAWAGSLAAGAATTRDARAHRDGVLTVLPFFAGERTPWWDDAASATIAGLRLSTTRAEIAAAIVESVMLRLGAAGSTLTDANPGITRAVASGGAFAARPELVQVCADVMGRPIALAADPEASARGAAIVALARIGALPSIDVAPVIARTYRPRRAATQRYRAMLERQARLHDALASARLTAD